MKFIRQGNTLLRITAMGASLALAACGTDDHAFQPRLVAFDDLQGFDAAPKFPAAEVFAASCDWLLSRDHPLVAPNSWRPACDAASTITSEAQAQAFFHEHFDVVQLTDEPGLMTGYFEPVFEGSQAAVDPYTAPILAKPESLVSVDLGAFRDDLRGERIAGQVDAGKLIPFADRSEIALTPPEDAAILGYMQPDDLFFLQIQGSGVIAFEDEERRIGYAAQNGHRYHAIGRTLVEEGHLALEDVTMQSIRAWLASADPEEAARIRATNPSYVFFVDRGPALSGEGPLGTMAVPLTADVSVAVDRTEIPLGAPVFVAASEGDAPWRRLTIAQDTGGAIKGPGRLDLFTGRGDEAGDRAGSLKQAISSYVLVPKGAWRPPAPTS